MSLAVATWIGAIATALLAVGAGSTVYYAGKAFTAQSQQLSGQGARAAEEVGRSP